MQRDLYLTTLCTTPARLRANPLAVERAPGSAETWLSPGLGHWAAPSAGSPAELVELLSKSLSIKRRKKHRVIVSASSQGTFTGVFMEQTSPGARRGGDGPRAPAPLLVGLQLSRPAAAAGGTRCLVYRIKEKVALVCVTRTVRS